MIGDTAHLTVLSSLNALVAGFFLLAAFGIVATRQMQASLKIFIAQSLLLAASAFILSVRYASVDLFIVGLLDLLTKPILIPWWLRRALAREVYTRREIDQSINIPMSLLIAMALIIFAYSIARGLLAAAPPDPFSAVNLPVGLAGLLLGAYTVTVRREAVSQMLGILAIENGAFFAGIAIVPNLPLIAELAAAVDVLLIGIVMGLLTRAIHERVGTTEVATLVRLQEAPVPQVPVREASGPPMDETPVPKTSSPELAETRIP